MIVREIVLLIFIIWSFGICAQESKIVLIEGYSKKYSIAREMRLEIDFSESSEVCGPGKQFNTVYDQFYSFAEKAKELGLPNFEFKELDKISNLSNKSPKVTFSCIIPDTVNIGSRLNYAADYAFADNLIFIDVFNDKNFEEEDTYARDALSDAIEKAQLLADLFGYSNYEVIYVDDDTSPQRLNGVKKVNLKREYRVSRQFYEEKLLSAYKLFVGFKFTD